MDDVRFNCGPWALGPTTSTLEDEAQSSIFLVEADWDDRNLLYSLRFDLGAAVLIPGSTLREL